MGNSIVKKYYEDDTWVCPAGVEKVKVIANLYREALSEPSSRHIFSSTLTQYSSGSNTVGELGVGDAINKSVPTAQAGNHKFKQLLSGTHFLGLNESGVAYTCGRNTYGELGNNSSATPVSSPVLVSGGHIFKKIARLDGSCYGLREDGKIYAWGLNDVGQLGVGDVTSYSVPTVVSGANVFTDVITCKDPSNSEHNFVLGQIATGQLYAWGVNTSGQLGDNSTTTRSAPVAVSGNIAFKTAKHFRHCMALTTDNKLYAWGNGHNGKLGSNGVANLSAPAEVVGGRTWKMFDIHDQVSYGVTTDGVLYSWGAGTSGALCDGSIVSKSSPVLVVGIEGINIKKIAAGNYALFILTEEGDVYSGGNNQYGILGHNDKNNTSSPTLVVGGHKFVDIHVSELAAFFTKADGTLYACGYNSSGGLGVNDTNPRSSPTLVVNSNVTRLDIVPKTINSYVYDVTPGTSYAIAINTYAPTFGGQKLAGDRVESVILEYEV